MSVQLVPFSDTDRLEALGLSAAAVSEIFLGAWPNVAAPALVEGASDDARWFAGREHSAAEAAFATLRRKRMEITDPWTGQALACGVGFTAPERGALPYDMLPLFYPFQSAAGHDFWLIGYTPSGRITHIYVPDQALMICDLDRDAAPALAMQVAALGPSSPLRDIRRDAGPARTVGILDMVTNSGHQLMNHLSGLDRLLEQAGPDAVDEIWVSGVEFFSPVEEIFPEIAGRLRRFADRWAMHAALRRADTLPVRIGTNIFRRGVRRRLAPLTIDARRTERGTAPWPLLAVTVRGDGRRCLNLPAMVESVVLALRQTYPRLGIVLDGWVIPDSQLVAGSAVGAILAGTFHRSAVAGALEIARQLSERLPRGVIVRNLIGTSMSASLEGLADVDAYLSHVGTLQHKIAFLTGVPGVVHGPIQQLRRPDTGHFQAEEGFAPLFLDVAAVRDAPSDSTRGDGSNDYEIVDVLDVVRKLEHVLDAHAGRRTT